MKIGFSRINKKEHDIVLWHYTTPDVLWKLLSGEFYATHCRFMNDSEEIIYGIRPFEEFFDKEESLRYLKVMMKDLLMRDFFLLCFSEDPDNLYHWRSYAPNGGFSIGLSYNKTCGLFNNIEYDLSDKKRLECDLVQCQYLSKDGITDFIRGVTTDLRKAIDGLSEKDRSLFDKCIDVAEANHILQAVTELYLKFPYLRKLLEDIPHLAFNLYAQCMAFKNPSFAVEKEYRLVVTGGDLRTQTEYIGNKPRIKIPTPELSKCIKGVYVSPHGDVEQNFLLAEIAKERFGLDFEIRRSESTFNGK